jgi:hypothetical protein
VSSARRCSSESVPDVPDIGCGTVHPDRNNIEPTNLITDPMLKQITPGNPPDLGLLARCDCTLRITELVVESRLYFAEDQRLTISRDDVDLTMPVAVVPFENLQTVPRKELAGNVFPLVAGSFVM